MRDGRSPRRHLPNGDFRDFERGVRNESRPQSASALGERGFSRFQREEREVRNEIRPQPHRRLPNVDFRNFSDSRAC